MGIEDTAGALYNYGLTRWTGQVDPGITDTTRFDKIRLVADKRIDSTCDVIVRLTFMEGNELVAFLDEVVLRPHSQLTRVYDVPGTKLEVSIVGVGAPRTKGSADVLIYGQY